MFVCENEVRQGAIPSVNVRKNGPMSQRHTRHHGLTCEATMSETSDVYSLVNVFIGKVYNIDESQREGLDVIGSRSASGISRSIQEVLVCLGG